MTKPVLACRVMISRFLPAPLDNIHLPDWFPDALAAAAMETGCQRMRSNKKMSPITAERRSQHGYRMKLHCDPRSPICRRIIVMAIESGLRDQIDVVERRTMPPSEPATGRVLGSVPALHREKGPPLVGAATICAYLDSLHEPPKLMPDKGEARLELEQLEAAADELIDVTLVLYRELCRPKDLQWTNEAEASRRRGGEVLDTLDSLTGTVLVGPVTLGHIAVGCALGWLDKHLPSDDWRGGHPALARWYARFANRPSMRATDPAST